MNKARINAALKSGFIKHHFTTRGNKMEHFIIAVRDRQLDAYLRPFTAASLGQAIRSFRDEVNRQDSDLAKHPEDYELYQLGTFEETTGKLTAIEPKQLALASNLKETK